MVQLEYVRKFILKDVNLHIPEGMAVGLIGESGAGKTTLLKLVSGLLLPDAGRVSGPCCRMQAECRPWDMIQAAIGNDMGGRSVHILQASPCWNLRIP